MESQQICAGLSSLNIACQLFVYNQEVCFFGSSDSANSGVVQGILEETYLVYIKTGLKQNTDDILPSIKSM